MIRGDSLSLLSLVSHFRPVTSAWAAVAFAAVGALFAFTLRGTLSVAQASTVSAASWMVFVLFNKQAFCNHHFLAGGMLCCAAAAWFPRPQA